MMNFVVNGGGEGETASNIVLPGLTLAMGQRL